MLITSSIRVRCNVVITSAPHSLEHVDHGRVAVADVVAVALDGVADCRRIKESTVEKNFFFKLNRLSVVPIFSLIELKSVKDRGFV